MSKTPKKDDSKELTDINRCVEITQKMPLSCQLCREKLCPKAQAAQR